MNIQALHRAGTVGPLIPRDEPGVESYRPRNRPRTSPSTQSVRNKIQCLVNDMESLWIKNLASEYVTGKTTDTYDEQENHQDKVVPPRVS